MPESFSSSESCLLSPASAQHWTAEAMIDTSGSNVLVCFEAVRVATEDSINHRHSTKVRIVS